MSYAMSQINHLRILAAGLAVVAASLVAAFVTAAPAAADTTQLVLTSPSGTVSRQEGSETVSFTLSNATTSDATATLVATDTASCRPQVIDGDVPAGRQSTVSFAIDGCPIDEARAAAMTLTAGASSFAVSVSREMADPDWTALQDFPRAIGLAAILVIVGYLWFVSFPRDLEAAPKGLHQTLPYLSASWSFKDSWATNVTLVSAIFTGVFGTTDLLKSITGDEQPGTLALITVASGIALAVVGAAPLALQILRTTKGETVILGLLVSATLAVGAAGGLTSIVADAAIALLPAGPAATVTIVKWIALLILAAYAVCSVRQNLAVGLRKPATVEDDKQTVIVHVGAVLAEHNATSLMPAVEQSLQNDYPVPARYPMATSPGDSYPAALL